MTGAIAQSIKPVGMKARVLRAGSWILGGQAVSQVLRLGTNVIVARLLFPDAFGLMSVVYMLATALALFSDLGVSRTLVLSHKGDDPDFLDTAWTIQFIRCQILALAICVAAGGVAVARHLGLWKAGTVYADERLPYLVVAFALTLVLQGFESIRILQARRKMQQHTLTKIDLAAQIASAIAMVIVAWTWHSIWALTTGAVVAGIARVILSYRLLPGHRVRFRIERSSRQELMGHAKWIFVSSVMTFMAANGDRVLLGGLITVREFGLYSIAVIMAGVLQNIANSVCNSIVFPALSEVHRERPQELPRSIERFQWAYDAMAVFPAAILIVSAQTLITLIYDTRYHDAGWMVMVLAAGVIGIRYQVVEMSYLAVAKTNYMAYANTLRLIALAAGLVVGRHYFGLVGAIVGVALSQYAAWPLAIWFKAQVRALTWRAEAMLVPAIAGGLLVGELISLAVRFAFPQHFAGH
jgi:O-antigen/teichoic acid export membrane protein